MEADRFLQLLQFEQINKAIPAIISIDKKKDIMIGKQDIMIEKILLLESSLASERIHPQ